MLLFKQFLKSLYSPKHIAFFRMQEIGKTIQYLFILALIMCLPVIISIFMYIKGGSHSAHLMIEKNWTMLIMNNELFSQNKLIFMFVFLLIYYLFLSFTIFIKSCFFAGIGLGIAFFSKKRGEYRHLFRMSAHALTLPSVVAALLDLTNLALPAGYWLDLIFVSIILFLSIRFLPDAAK